MKTIESTIRVLFLFALAVAMLAAVDAWNRQSVAAAQSRGLPNTAELDIERNRQLSQVNANLEKLSVQIEGLKKLFESGKVVVLVREAPAPAAGGGQQDR